MPNVPGILREQEFIIVITIIGTDMTKQMNGLVFCVFRTIITNILMSGGITINPLRPSDAYMRR